MHGRPGGELIRACYLVNPNREICCRGAGRQFHEQVMRKIRWKLIAPIGLMVFSQIASAAPDNRVTTAGARFELAQAANPPASATTPAATTAPAPLPDSKGPDAPSPAATASPNPPSPAEVVRRPPSAPGCALRYMAAEVAGKAKGRKWKEFRQEECGPSTTTAVFPSEVSPKYSGIPADKARTRTCADQFSVNKATNANGGLKWIEMGGGYYSECVSRLKG
jgi:hypothetical protein